MDKMQPMSSPLGGDQNEENPVLRGTTNIQSSPLDPTIQGGVDQDTGDDRGLRKLTSRLEDRRLKTHMDIDRLDTHLGEEDMTENKTDDDQTINKRRKDKLTPKEDSLLNGLRVFVPPTIRDYNTLMRFMQTHIVEFRFERRHDKMGYNKNRRMIATANWKYLSSIFTRKIFNWNTPATRRGVSWYKRRNLMIVWDLMVKNFRIIPVSDIRFISAYKCTSLMEKGRFLLFYKRHIGSLSEAQQKIYFNK